MFRVFGQHTGLAVIRSRGRRVGLAVALVAGAALVISGAGLATADSDNVTYSGRTLHSPTDSAGFDISWVEQSTGRYFLADHTNAAVDWFSLANDVNGDAFAAYLGKGQFVGNGPAVCPVAHACAGPNGVVTDKQHRIWAGDGPTTPGSPSNSIKMIDLPVSQNVAKTIGLGGKFRADELAYDPSDQVIEIASDGDGFLSFVSTVPGSEGVLSTFYYADNIDGKPASAPGVSTAGGGIEQPVWDGKTGLFYQAIPGNPDKGRVDLFTAGGTFVKSFDATGCSSGPTGLVLVDNEQLIGACGNGGMAMDIHTGKVRTIIPNVGGADEVWFNPGDGNAYFAKFGFGGDLGLGVADARSDRYVTTLPTQFLSHSVAAYASRTNQILVPLAGNGIKVFVSPGKGPGGD